MVPSRSRENRSPEIPAAMASGTPVREIQEETNCPICLEYLMDPVTIQCGHNFCRSCISQYCETWEEQDSDPLCCPSCRARIRKGAFQSNYQLANIVEKIKQMDFKRGKENLCERHGKALDLFCEEDGKAMCVVCERSLEHRSHTVLLMDDAAQKYKEKIQAHLKTLREEREKLLGSKVTREEKSPKYMKQIEKKRQQIVADFQQLHQFLEKQEELLLAQLEKLEEEITKIQNENITKVSEEISHLSNLISELEGKCQKPASEFLQDIRSTLSRCEKGKFQQPEEELQVESMQVPHSSENQALGPKSRHPRYRPEMRGCLLKLDPAHHSALVLDGSCAEPMGCGEGESSSHTVRNPPAMGGR
ncbi:tripartite motif-containing protein 10-like [Mauremys mutica]|uniref:tripartite motif-containing protein 10-like n=1 Tax=Mauremys mutica TaxID=74926 RepID=UPI001D16EFAA|nr:tripartite motif-containing protein 10-like [Mauremys mutica]